jgi:hypothetical protein
VLVPTVQFGERGSCGGCNKIAFGVGGEVCAATRYGKSAAGNVGGIAAFSADFFNGALYVSRTNSPLRKINVGGSNSARASTETSTSTHAVPLESTRSGGASVTERCVAAGAASC